MTSPNAAIHELLRLRLLVAALGERLPKPWWRSQFLSPTGLRYMERIFPRRYVAAALESTAVAAGRDHDANVGARSYHLFRLPPHLEDRLAEAVAEGALDSDKLPEAVPELLAQVAKLGSEAELPTGTGPKSLGSVDGILKPSVLAKMAGLYARAAQDESRIYPYLEANQNE